MTKYIILAIVLLGAVNFLLNLPQSSPTDAIIAAKQCAWQTGNGLGKITPLDPKGALSDPILESWVKQVGTVVNTYSIPYQLRAASFKFERLPAYDSPASSPAKGAKVFPVKATLAIERTYARGNIPAAVATARLPLTQSRETLYYYYFDKGTRVWAFETQKP